MTDAGRYPHVCYCGAAAFVGPLRVACSSWKCKHYELPPALQLRLKEFLDDEEEDTKPGGWFAGPAGAP